MLNFDALIRHEIIGTKKKNVKMSYSMMLCVKWLWREPNEF